MLELTQLIQGLAPALETNVGILVEIIKGIYCISSGGVTMKNISRWTDKGQLSKHSAFFFLFHGLVIPQRVVISLYLYGKPLPYALHFSLGRDGKRQSDKHTFGVNWFYSSIAGRVIRSVSNHVISIVDTKKEKSFVLEV